jgi:hypothetical protein
MLKVEIPAAWPLEWARLMLDTFEPNLPPTREHVNALIAKGIARETERKVLGQRLLIAALRYFEGRGVDYWIAEQSSPNYRARLAHHGERELWSALKKLGRGFPPRRSDHWYIQEMAAIWRGLGHRPTTAYARKTKTKRGKEKTTRFVQFCNDWLRAIDPERRHLPKNSIFKSAIKR